MLAIVLVMATAQPAAAATKPAQVKPMSIVAASTTSLTLKWSAVSKATNYEVYYATNYGMAKAIKKKVGKRTSYRVAGLAKGRTYCFQIRAVRGKTTGKKSNRTCKPTIVAQGATTGAPVRIMTYNICSTKPGCQASWNWATRRPHAAALIEAYQPDVVALQESERGDGIDSELAGYITMDQAGERYAVWAELKDTTNDHRFIFVSVHTAAGKSYTYDAPRKVFNGQGYYDAYDLAATLTRPNYNSYNAFTTTPAFSKRWGDHVDHVWVKPSTQVRHWQGVVRLNGSKLATPIPSDHNPVKVDLTIPLS